MIRTLAQHRIIRYLFVGGFSYAIEIVTLYSANHILQLSAAISVTISFWVSFIVAYILQKLVTFKNKQKTRKAMTYQIVGFSLLVLWNYGFTILVVELFHTTVSVIVLRTIVILVATLWNYFLYKKLFKDDTLQIV